jgi:Ca2+-binding RTX toxin-like protein
MALTDIFAGLESLLPREPDGANNDDNGDNLDDIGEVGDPYLRITPDSYVANATGGPDGGMALPVTPTDDFSGFLAGLPPPAAAFFNFILDSEGRPAGGPPDNAPDILVGDLPQAAAISDAVMDLLPDDQNHPSSFAVNELFDFIGQVITHDVAEASTLSDDLPMLIDGLPFPFARTHGIDDANDVRQQVNEETSFLDLSFVYGNSQAREDLARAGLDSAPEQSAKLLLGADGLLPTIAQVAADSGIDNDSAKTGSLEVLEIYTEPGFAGLPDPTTVPLDGSQDSTFENLAYTGDNRANQQSPLLTLQTVWAREHNYQVDQLTPYATAHGWTQDQLFEAARAISETEWQHIVFEEYVPKLIGTQADDLVADYKATHSGEIPVGIINEWTTVAFRFGHDQSSNDYTVIDANGATTVFSLADAFGLAGAATAEGIDAWIRGLSAQFTQEIDGKIADGNREFLFGGLGGTVDLEAFDIQRGRDHGVGNYNTLIAGLFGNDAKYTSFDDFAARNGYDSSDPTIVALKSVYGADGIDKADSIVMGLLEQKYADSQFGETFTLLNALQFEALKGDEFYFENRLSGNPELLAEIKGITFAEVLDRNSGANHLNLDSFGVANPLVYGDGRDTKYGADDPTYLKADLMIGKGGNDSLYGKDGSDTLYGDAGNDKLDGGKGDDFLKGGYGNDDLYGAKGNDQAWGEDGNDCINLDGGDDWANGGAGNDKISCGDGSDIALGKEGRDDISGGKGSDELFGGDDKDSVSGDAGDDKCYGGAGDDCVAGGAGTDWIVGEAGNDQLSGGSGYDTFAFGADSGKDKITDFSVKYDVIDLSEFEQFQSFADVKDAMTTKRGSTIITIDDGTEDGHADTIELVGVSMKMLKDGSFVYHEDAPVV